MPIASDACVLVHIQGDVQGVGFRYYAQLEARKLGLRGWVKNLADGSVQCCIAGGDAQIHSMQSWLEDGPRHAIVERITCSKAVLTDERPDFYIRS